MTHDTISTPTTQRNPWDVCKMLPLFVLISCMIVLKVLRNLCSVCLPQEKPGLTSFTYKMYNTHHHFHAFSHSGVKPSTFQTTHHICCLWHFFFAHHVNTPVLLETHYWQSHAACVTPVWGLYAPRGQPPVREEPPHLCCTDSMGTRSTGLRVSRLS